MAPPCATAPSTSSGDGWHGISGLALPDGYQVSERSGDTDRLRVAWRATDDQDDPDHEGLVSVDRDGARTR
ncbi:MAG: hypothetical protein GEV12_09530 [Micromonosporaceae bacterium]|nr:hypothetical protein [Micromonosporaceae bacterium]